jgi:carboxymethylenebutenolidase
MCDSDLVAKMPRVNRREFARMGVMTGAGAMLAGRATSAAAQNELGALTEVEFDAPGGRMDGIMVTPAEGKFPGIIMWPDIAGIRDAKVSMARLLARAGYSVLIANPYYRSVKGAQFDDFEDFRENGGFQKVGPWMQKNTPEAIAETVQAVVEFLDGHDSVDTSRGIGTQGYCMTGSWTIRGAAAVPGRIKAAASFHGGGLVGPEPDSPVNLLDDIAPDCKVLIAIARNDDANAPDDKVALRNAADAAGIDAKIEVFAGDHGWTVLDSPVYDYDEEERATDMLLDLYETL